MRTCLFLFVFPARPYEVTQKDTVKARRVRVNDIIVVIRLMDLSLIKDSEYYIKDTRGDYLHTTILLFSILPFLSFTPPVNTFY